MRTQNFFYFLLMMAATIPLYPMNMQKVPTMDPLTLFIRRDRLRDCVYKEYNNILHNQTISESEQEELIQKKIKEEFVDEQQGKNAIKQLRIQKKYIEFIRANKQFTSQQKENYLKQLLEENSQSSESLIKLKPAIEKNNKQSDFLKKLNLPKEYFGPLNLYQLALQLRASENFYPYRPAVIPNPTMLSYRPSQTGQEAIYILEEEKKKQQPMKPVEGKKINALLPKKAAEKNALLQSAQPVPFEKSALLLLQKEKERLTTIIANHIKINDQAIPNTAINTLSSAPIFYETNFLLYQAPSIELLLTSGEKKEAAEHELRLFQYYKKTVGGVYRELLNYLGNETKLSIEQECDLCQRFIEVESILHDNTAISHESKKMILGLVKDVGILDLLSKDKRDLSQLLLVYWHALDLHMDTATCYNDTALNQEIGLALNTIRTRYKEFEKKYSLSSASTYATSLKLLLVKSMQNLGDPSSCAFAKSLLKKICKEDPVHNATAWYERAILKLIQKDRSLQKALRGIEYLLPAARAGDSRIIAPLINILNSTETSIQSHSNYVLANFPLSAYTALLPEHQNYLHTLTEKCTQLQKKIGSFFRQDSIKSLPSPQQAEKVEKSDVEEYMIIISEAYKLGLYQEVADLSNKFVANPPWKIPFMILQMDCERMLGRNQLVDDIATDATLLLEFQTFYQKGCTEDKKKHIRHILKNLIKQKNSSAAYINLQLNAYDSHNNTENSKFKNECRNELELCINHADLLSIASNTLLSNISVYNELIKKTEFHCATTAFAARLLQQSLLKNKPLSVRYEWCMSHIKEFAHLLTSQVATQQKALQPYKKLFNQFYTELKDYCAHTPGHSLKSHMLIFNCYHGILNNTMKDPIQQLEELHKKNELDSQQLYYLSQLIIPEQSQKNGEINTSNGVHPSTHYMDILRASFQQGNSDACAEYLKKAPSFYSDNQTFLPELAWIETTIQKNPKFLNSISALWVNYLNTIKHYKEAQEFIAQKNITIDPGISKLLSSLTIFHETMDGINKSKDILKGKTAQEYLDKLNESLNLLLNLFTDPTLTNQALTYIEQSKMFVDLEELEGLEKKLKKGEHTTKLNGLCQFKNALQSYYLIITTNDDSKKIKPLIFLAGYSYSPFNQAKLYLSLASRFINAKPATAATFIENAKKIIKNIKMPEEQQQIVQQIKLLGNIKQSFNILALIGNQGDTLDGLEDLNF